MPHVIVKLYAGRSDDDKMKLAEQITKAVTSALKCEEKSVSVAVEDVNPADWAEKVYKPDIVERADSLYKTPGYNPFK